MPPRPSSRPEAGRASRVPALLLLLGAALSAADWLRPLSGTHSLVVAGALSLLVLPWAAVVLRDERLPATQPALIDRGPRMFESLRGRMVFHGSLLLLLLGFIAAKWLLLLHASGDGAEFTGTSRSYTLAILLVYAIGLFGRGVRGGRFIALAADHPARLMALSFGMTGLLGALLLSLPISALRMSGVSLVDNLFMAFSAVCVTGLSVTAVSHTYSPFGQAVLCVLMQLGGLGIMVLSASVLVLARRRMRVRSSAVLAQMVDVASLAGLRRTIASIVLYTLAIEAVGAAVLYVQLLQHDRDTLAGVDSVAWVAVFHAIAAFCNAGLSNLHDGLLPFKGDAGVAATLAVLIVLGGLGFPVLQELIGAGFDKLRRRRLRAFSLHTRVSLRTSALLLAVMAIAYLALEWNASMHGYDLKQRITAAIFQSVSCRSGGLNLVEIGAMTQPMLVLTCAAMMIGASPGSTGGGIKTTTFAVLFAGLRAELSGRSPRLLDRAIPLLLIRKAMAVAFLSIAIVSGMLFLILLLEPHEPLALGFEVVSAFSTTGLSTGITPELSVAGKLLITVSMFIGRIGPLTLALAVSLPAQQRAVELPAERMMIG